MGARNRVRQVAGRLLAVPLVLACLCGCEATPGTGAPGSPLGSEPAAPATVGMPLAGDCDAAELGAPDEDPASILAAAEAAEAAGTAVRMSWYSPDAGVMTAGSLEDLPAWSTSKIPLALAVIASGQGEVYSDAIALALEESDNDAADTLWNALGETDAERADAVTGVLRTAGDATTTVPDVQLVAGFSVFGQTQWATGDQVAFLAQLPCLDGADEVIADMGRVDPAQSWGIGALPGATYKGGWGPSPDGGYLARELGWYTNAAGQRVLVAMAAQDPDGFDAATAVLDQLAAALG